MQKPAGFGVLKPDHELEIRKTVLRTPIGATVVMPIGDLTLERAQAAARSYGNRSKNFVLILESSEDAPGHLHFKRVTEAEAKNSTYLELDALKIGDSHLFRVPHPLHQRIRIAASNRNRMGTVMLSCSVEAGGIRVTRHALTASEVQAHGVTPKPSKYGLERLETQPQLVFNLPSLADQTRLRQAVSTKARLMGWTVRCRLQDDGTMLVVRTGAAA